LKQSSKVGFGTQKAYDIEAREFGKLTMEPVTKACINIFNANNHCTKNKWGKPEKPVKEIAVLGAGLMGAGIAQVSIDKENGHIINNNKFHVFGNKIYLKYEAFFLIFNTILASLFWTTFIDILATETVNFNAKIIPIFSSF